MIVKMSNEVSIKKSFNMSHSIRPTHVCLNDRSKYLSGRSTTTLRRNIDGIESKKRKMLLLKELSQTSRDSFESESDSKESRDVRLNLFKSGIFHVLQILGELSRTSQDSFESESDSKESQDDRLNSFKSGIFNSCHFWAN